MQNTGSSSFLRSFEAAGEAELLAVQGLQEVGVAIVQWVRNACLAVASRLHGAPQKRAA